MCITVVIMLDPVCFRRDSAHGAGEPVPAAQIGQSGEVCDVLWGFTRRRGVRFSASHRSQTRIPATNVRHYHYSRHLLHRIHPGTIAIVYKIAYDI